ncbi:hypothetical protein V6N12_062403 [Hibiscus sabdariffa]|uniref:Protein-serine/threonine phosphatase n=1 Tax=Hibiscus sabdariffa TaxID=183260 RepID=A0ABR2F8R9_9ROSI
MHGVPLGCYKLYRSGGGRPSRLSVRHFPQDELFSENKKRSKATEDAAAASHNDSKGKPLCSREEEEEEVEELQVPRVTHGYDLVEDYVVVESRRIKGHDIGLYAIFDGHSGPDVAKYLPTHLFDKILDQANVNLKEVGDTCMQVMSKIREFGNAQQASQVLIKQALAWGSHDDISCILVAFHSWPFFPFKLP